MLDLHFFLLFLRAKIHFIWFLEQLEDIILLLQEKQFVKLYPEREQGSNKIKYRNRGQIKATHKDISFDLIEALKFNWNYDRQTDQTTNRPFTQQTDMRNLHIQDKDKLNTRSSIDYHQNEKKWSIIVIIIIKSLQRRHPCIAK